jgi:hypothetical protein
MEDSRASTRANMTSPKRTDTIKQNHYSNKQNLCCAKKIKKYHFSEIDFLGLIYKIRQHTGLGYVLFRLLKAGFVSNGACLQYCTAY